MPARAAQTPRMADFHDELPDPIRSLAGHQCGVLTFEQLRLAGLSDALVQRRLRRNRWRAVSPVVVVLHNGPLTRRQAFAAAVLSGGEECGLAAWTAAEAAGLRGWERPGVHILVSKGSKPALVGGVETYVHESRRFSKDDLVAAWPPRVSIERSLVDAAVWTRKIRPACGILAAGVQQRLTVPESLIATLDAAGAVRHRRVLRAALIDISGGAQAVSEMDFLRFCDRNALPRPLLQNVRVDSKGRRRYLDATFRRRDGKLVRVEIDGALHLVAHTYWADMFRQNDLAIGHELVLRFASFVIYANDPDAIEQLRRALNLSEPHDYSAA